MGRQCQIDPTDKALLERLWKVQKGDAVTVFYNRPLEPGISPVSTAKPTLVQGTIMVDESYGAGSVARPARVIKGRLGSERVEIRIYTGYGSPAYLLFH
jgi:hypothetical protein